jgi:hypothetical protein
MENTNNLSSNGLDPRRLNDALERIDTLEDFIRVMKYVTPEALPQIRQEAAELLWEIWAP